MGLDGQFANAQFRQSDWPAMRNALCVAFRKQERAHWCNVLEQHDICFSPVLSLSEAIEDEHMRERYIRDDNGAIRHRPAPRFSRTPCPLPVDRVAADNGEWDMLLDWGIGLDFIEEASTAGAVAAGCGGS